MKKQLTSMSFDTIFYVTSDRCIKFLSLHTDAINYALGADDHMNEYPIGYTSRLFRNVDKKYSTTER